MPRARDLVSLGQLPPGPLNAITAIAEETIVDALFAAETTTGRDGHTMPALPIAETLEILRRRGVTVRDV